MLGRGGRRSGRLLPHLGRGVRGGGRGWGLRHAACGAGLWRSQHGHSQGPRQAAFSVEVASRVCSPASGRRRPAEAASARGGHGGRGGGQMEEAGGPPRRDHRGNHLRTVRGPQDRLADTAELAAEPQELGGGPGGEGCIGAEARGVLLPRSPRVGVTEGALLASNSVTTGGSGQGNRPVLPAGARRAGAERGGGSLEGEVLYGAGFGNIG